MWVNVKFREKRRERALMDEVKTLQPKTSLATPTSSTLAPSRTTSIQINNTTQIKKVATQTFYDNLKRL